jgi:hypothetical protein
MVSTVQYSMRGYSIYIRIGGDTLRVGQYVWVQSV